uniref:Mannosyltransferase n=1 Tax=Timema douglasi TaxID=61478 RepID=A0A7R8VGS1_TIMDO|nr:unnamed protein product [Timema douglasi]
MKVPRLAQALLSSLGDFYFWKWYSNETRTSGLWAAYSFATSWFWFYCASRTLTNTIETVLTIFGLYSFPWHPIRKEKEVYHKFLRLSGESDSTIIVTPISSGYCTVERRRETSFVEYKIGTVFVPSGPRTELNGGQCVKLFPLSHFHQAMFPRREEEEKNSSSGKGGGLADSGGCGLSLFFLDTFFYGRWIFTPWNFLKVNILSGIGSFYGSHPVYWYFIIGIPAVLGFHLIPFIISIFKSWQNPKESSIETLLIAVVIWTIFIFRPNHFVPSSRPLFSGPRAARFSRSPSPFLPCAVGCARPRRARLVGLSGLSSHSGFGLRSMRADCSRAVGSSILGPLRAVWSDCEVVTCGNGDGRNESDSQTIVKTICVRRPKIDQDFVTFLVEENGEPSTPREAFTSPHASKLKEAIDFLLGPSKDIDVYEACYRHVKIWTVTLVLLLNTVLPGIFFGIAHNRGTLDVMNVLAKVGAKYPTQTSLLFLMPCHSTPLYRPPEKPFTAPQEARLRISGLAYSKSSALDHVATEVGYRFVQMVHLHVDIPAKFLTCEPDFSNSLDYLDEVEQFYNNPDKWLNNRYPTNITLPSHIVIFEPLYHEILGFLNQRGFTIFDKIFHTYFPEGRVGEFVYNIFGLFSHFYLPLFITGLLLPTDNISVIEGTPNCDGIVRCYVLILAIRGQTDALSIGQAMACRKQLVAITGLMALQLVTIPSMTLNTPHFLTSLPMSSFHSMHKHLTEIHLLLLNYPLLQGLKHTLGFVNQSGLDEMEQKIVSQRDKQKYVDNGFLYVFDKFSVDGQIKFWRCEGKNNNCKARLHTRGEEVVKRLNEHTHDSSSPHIGAQEVVSKIKQRAAETRECTSQVINECTIGLTQAAKGVLPKADALKKLVRRKRNQINAAPPVPANLQTLIIPDRYKMYVSETDIEENFLLSDSGPDANRILIFGRQRNLQILRDAEALYGDGTFKTAPLLFAQIYTVLARVISALAFVPENDLDQALDLLAEELPDNLQPRIDWFEDNYIGRRNRRGVGRRVALFPPNMWNLYTRVLNGTDHTNSRAEAAHRRLGTELGMQHPTIWKFIDALRKVQAARDIYYEHLVAGHEATPKKRNYREVDARILRLLSRRPVSRAQMAAPSCPDSVLRQEHQLDVP